MDLVRLIGFWQVYLSLEGDRASDTVRQVISETLKALKELQERREKQP